MYIQCIYIISLFKKIIEYSATRHTNYTIPNLRKNIPLGLDTVTLENIKNYFRKARQYMFCYTEGLAAGPELEKQIKKYKKIYKSHRKINVTE